MSIYLKLSKKFQAIPFAGQIIHCKRDILNANRSTLLPNTKDLTCGGCSCSGSWYFWAFKFANVVVLVVARLIIYIAVSVSQTVTSTIRFESMACVRPRKQMCSIRMPLQLVYTPSIPTISIVWIIQSSPKLALQYVVLK